MLYGIPKIYGQGYSERLKKVQQLTDSLQFDAAISQLYDLLKDSRKDRNDTLTIKILIKLGSIHLDVEKNEIGIDYYRDALILATATNNPKQIANANYGIGAALQQMELYDSSKVYYKVAIKYFEEVNDKLTLSYILSNLSLLHHMLDQKDSMKFYSNLALNIQLNIGDKYGSGASYSNLGLISKNEGKYQEASKYYLSSLSEYSEVGYIKGRSETLRSLGITYFLLGKYDSSAYYFYTYDSIGHDVFHEDYQDKILELETKFKTAEIERDNALKQAEIEENKKQLALLYAFSAFLILAFISVYFFFNQRRKRLKLASEKAIKDLLQEQETQTTYALLEGQDKERKRIAAELHDSLGSILVTLNMYADTLISKKPEEMEKLAKKISETAQLANEETRKISHSLDSGMLKHFGLEAAIHQLSEAVSAARKIKFEVNIQLHDALSTETSLEIYRIIQELVNNTLKHARCSTIRLDLTHIKGSLNLIYEDNGVGFKKEDIQSGIGLKNIENRVSKLDGELTIDSSPEKGSTFIAEISAV